MNFVNNINLNKYQLLNAVVQPLSVAPSSPNVGQIYFDTGIVSLMQWNGSGWAILDATKLTLAIPNGALATNPLARANHTGTQPSSTISDLAATVEGYTLDRFAAPVANVSMNGYQLNNLADPSLPTDAATKNYVDTSVQAAAAGIDSKPTVRVVATSNVVLSGLQTVDSVSLNVGDRVLCVAQTTASQNGTYVAASGAWARASDDSSTNELTPGAFWYVSEGAIYGKTQWIIQNVGTIVVGTTAITINQFGAASMFSAGNGLTLVGEQFNVVPGLGILADGSSTRVDTSVVARKYSTTIGDGTNSTYTVTHGLGTQDVQVTIRQVSTNYIVYTDCQPNTTTTVVVVFGSAIASNSYRVTVIG